MKFPWSLFTYFLSSIGLFTTVCESVGSSNNLLYDWQAYAQFAVRNAILSVFIRHANLPNFLKPQLFQNFSHSSHTVGSYLSIFVCFHTSLSLPSTICLSLYHTRLSEECLWHLPDWVVNFVLVIVSISHLHLRPYACHAYLSLWAACHTFPFVCMPVSPNCLLQLCITFLSACKSDTLACLFAPLSHDSHLPIYLLLSHTCLSTYCMLSHLPVCMYLCSTCLIFGSSVCLPVCCSTTPTCLFAPVTSACLFPGSPYQCLTRLPVSLFLIALFARFWRHYVNLSHCAASTTFLVRYACAVPCSEHVTKPNIPATAPLINLTRGPTSIHAV